MGKEIVWVEANPDDPNLPEKISFRWDSGGEPFEVREATELEAQESGQKRQADIDAAVQRQQQAGQGDSDGDL